DGKLDNGEGGLSGWTVTLHATSGGAADQTFTTGASGAFSFGGLAAGTYTLTETMQPGYQQTQPGAASSFSYTLTVTSQFTGTFTCGNQVFAAPTGLAITPDAGVSATDGVTDTGSVAFSGTASQPGLTVDLMDLTAGKDLGKFAVSGTTFSVNLTLAEGSHQIQAQAFDSAGDSSLTSTFTVLVDLSKPASKVSALPRQQSSNTF